MKSFEKLTLVFMISGLCLSACTFGDKGSEKATDSLRVDTSHRPSAGVGTAGTGTGQDSAVDTSQDTTMKDTAK